MGIQNSENENDSPQEDVDGEKLKELERSLDGLFDDIMTPPAARPLLGGDMTLPKRAWKHSKPVRDDVWRQDIPGNVSSPLLSSKTSSSKELKKDSTIPSPLPMRNMSNLSSKASAFLHLRLYVKKWTSGACARKRKRTRMRMSMGWSGWPTAQRTGRQQQQQQ